MYIVISGGIAFVCLFFPFTKAQAALFSPGHGLHDGKVPCQGCHLPFEQTYDCTTSNCHPATIETYKTKADLAFHKIVANRSCTTCHPEHAGSVDHYANQPFDHTLLNASELGKCLNCHDQPQDFVHSGLRPGLSCTNCHTTTVWVSVRFDHASLRPDSLAKCSLCHALPQDRLHQFLNDNCADCHRTDAWFPAGMNHTDLNPVGRVSCGDCHRAPQDSVHVGVGIDCGRCHNTDNWTVP